MAKKYAEQRELSQVFASAGEWSDGAALRGEGKYGIQTSEVAISDSGDVIIPGLLQLDDEIQAFGLLNTNILIGSDVDFQSGASILNLTTGSGAAIRTALGFEFARKASDETINSSTTMQDDDDLVLSFDANETALVTMAATLQTTAAADVKIGFTFPTGGTLHLVGTIGRGNNSNFSGNVYLSSSGEEQSFPMTGFKSVLHLTGIYRNGGTSGNLQFQWAQNTSDAGDTKFFADSALWKMRYA